MRPADLKTIPLSAPLLDGNEFVYLRECVASGWVSSAGPFVTRLERELAERVALPHAVATSSGTAALHLALRVTGVEPEDEVIVPALTFVATANAVRHAGAWPVLLDSEPVHGQLDPAELARFLEDDCREEAGVVRRRASGRRVRAVLPVHLLGHPCDMDATVATARRFGLAVIEDASEALGARYRSRPVGALGDVGCFSFNGNKVVTAGGGGMLVTASAAWAERARRLSTQCRSDPIEYLHDEVGFNYRMTNLNAALGCAQLERLERFVAARRSVAAAYADGLAGIDGLAVFEEADWAHSIHWLSAVRIDPERFGVDSRGLRLRLVEAGIESRPLWTPLHRTEAHAGAEGRPCPVAEALAREALCLPSSAGLQPEQLARVVAAVRGARATRARRKPPVANADPLGSARPPDPAPRSDVP